MTEYIPGGEGLCDWDISHPNEMRRQIQECKGRIINSKTGEAGKADTITAAASKDYEVTSGFVTRTWKNEASNEEDQHRVFHVGYAIN